MILFKSIFCSYNISLSFLEQQAQKTSNNPFENKPSPKQEGVQSSNHSSSKSAEPTRNIQIPARVVEKKPDPDQLDREGGYGSYYDPKTYEANAHNPFKQVCVNIVKPNRYSLFWIFIYFFKKNENMKTFSPLSSL